MEWREASTHNCPVGRALDLLGEKWTLAIVRDALNGVKRFDDFKRHMGLSEAVLADRLRKLVDAGVLETRPYREPGHRERNEYAVTERGIDLVPVIIALKQWGEAHLGDPNGPVIEVKHRKCDGDVRVVLQCSAHKQAKIGPRETIAVPGPGARLAKTAKVAR